MDKKILWVDLEMTGLNPKKDRILEVAAIITDWDFNEIATFESAVKVSPKIIKERMVGDFWDKFSDVKNSLIEQNRQSSSSSKEVEQELISFLNEHFKEDISNNEKIILAGNSIHQDRRFIRSEWKNLDELLHYRMLDVTSWKIVMNEKYHHVFAKPEEHRALDDIRGSIMELKYYLKKVKK